MTSELLQIRRGLSGYDDDDDQGGHADAHAEESPPGYDEATLAAPTVPDYDQVEHHTHTERLLRYRLVQCDRRTQVLELVDQNQEGGDGAPACLLYRITCGSSFRLSLPFSLKNKNKKKGEKKPEIQVLQTLQPGVVQRYMASIWFEHEGGFPWRPQAQFEYTGDDGLSSRCRMEAARFEEWGVVGDGLVWRLRRRKPVALVLSDGDDGDTAEMPVARFTFSSRGICAHKGEEVGVLEISRERLQRERLGERAECDRVVCGVVVVITFFRRMGKLYCNRGVEDNGG